MNKKSHYDWLEDNLQDFFKKVHINQNNGIIVSHGDKCYSYQKIWEEAGVPFEHGVALYLLSHCSPFDKECRDTENGWVAPMDWVINNYSRFLPYLNPPTSK
jgi:hypothetical protein